jgi:pimeloyl-ACP methyl ester carboxylesterase
MPRIDVNGLRTHYQQTGEGPDVVLVHAFTGNLSVWMMIGLLDELARDFRVTAYDLRGHGLSEVTERGYDSAQMADDLHALHAHLGLGPAYLVGHSYGGVIAAHAAVRHPEIVRGIIAADTYFPGLAHIEENVADTAIWTELKNDLARCGLDVGERVDFARLFEVIKNLSPEQSEAIRRTMGPAAARWLGPLGRLAGTQAGTEMFAVAGLTEEVIRGIDVPVVGLYDDQTTFGATCRYLEEHLPNCVIDTVPGARHIAPLQSPEEFVRLVKKHLHELTRGEVGVRGER